MTSSIQLLTFFISFIYGMLFYFFTIFNFKMIENLKKYIQHIITFIYVIDITIIYTIIIYNVNKGYFHIYFIFSVFIGYFVAYITNIKLLSKINVKKNFRR